MRLGLDCLPADSRGREEEQSEKYRKPESESREGIESRRSRQRVSRDGGIIIRAREPSKRFPRGSVREYGLSMRRDPEGPTRAAAAAERRRLEPERAK